MNSLISLVVLTENILSFLILARVILSFIPNIDPQHPVARFIYNATEPILLPFRNLLPSTRIGLDFSPLLAFFVIHTVAMILRGLLMSL